MLVGLSKKNYLFAIDTMEHQLNGVYKILECLAYIIKLTLQVPCTQIAGSPSWVQGVPSSTMDRVA